MTVSPLMLRAFGSRAAVFLELGSCEEKAFAAASHEILICIQLADSCLVLLVWCL